MSSPTPTPSPTPIPTQNCVVYPIGQMPDNVLNMYIASNPDFRMTSTGQICANLSPANANSDNIITSCGDLTSFKSLLKTSMGAVCSTVSSAPGITICSYSKDSSQLTCPMH